MYPPFQLWTRNDSLLPYLVLLSYSFCVPLRPPEADSVLNCFVIYYYFFKLHKSESLSNIPFSFFNFVISEWILLHPISIICFFFKKTKLYFEEASMIYTMEYYSAIKKNSFESVLMRWIKLEPIIQSEVSQKDKDHYIWNLERR